MLILETASTSHYYTCNQSWTEDKRLNIDLGRITSLQDVIKGALTLDFFMSCLCLGFVNHLLCSGNVVKFPDMSPTLYNSV